MTEPTPGPPALSPALAAHRDAFRAIRERAEALTAGLTDEQARWRPAPERWSIAHCLDHLNLAGRAYLPRLDAAIEEARRRGLTGDGPFRPGLLGGWLVRTMEPPPRRRFRAPKTFAPELSTPPRQIFGELSHLQEELIARVEAADGLDLAKIRFSSVVLPLLRLHLGDWLAFLAAHERRHLWQAEEVRRAEGFPASDGSAPP